MLNMLRNGITAGLDRAWGMKEELKSKVMVDYNLVPSFDDVLVAKKKVVDTVTFADKRNNVIETQEGEVPSTKLSESFEIEQDELLKRFKENLNTKIDESFEKLQAQVSKEMKKGILGRTLDDINNLEKELESKDTEPDTKESDVKESKEGEYASTKLREGFEIKQDELLNRFKENLNTKISESFEKLQAQVSKEMPKGIIERISDDINKSEKELESKNVEESDIKESKDNKSCMALGMNENDFDEIDSIIRYAYGEDYDNYEREIDEYYGEELVEHEYTTDDLEEYYDNYVPQEVSEEKDLNEERKSEDVQNNVDEKTTVLNDEVQQELSAEQISQLKNITENWKTNTNE